MSTESVLIEPKDAVNLRNAIKYDPRFPQQNLSNQCWTAHVAWRKCEHDRGEDAKECLQLKIDSKSICPPSWVEDWINQEQNGVFPGSFFLGRKQQGQENQVASSLNKLSFFFFLTNNWVDITSYEAWQMAFYLSCIYDNPCSIPHIRIDKYLRCEPYPLGI